MEDKQKICDSLCETLKLTRSHADLEALKYDDKAEMVEVIWKHGGRVVNVAMDSGAAMIQDIMRAID